MTRLLILAALVMLVYFSVRSYFRAPEKNLPRQQPPTPPDFPTADTSDLMARDPICGTYVEPGSSLSVTKQGVTHYFCSKKCRDEFLNRG